MEIRAYQNGDCTEIVQLFYDTVHTVNAKDYTEEQLFAWAPDNINFGEWERSFAGHDCLVAVEDGKIVAFGDADANGYLDRLFVHRDYQRKGAASAICEQLERKHHGKMFTCASITARPFFEKRGYRVIKEQQVQRRSVTLTNFVMVR